MRLLRLVRVSICMMVALLLWAMAPGLLQAQTAPPVVSIELRDVGLREFLSESLRLYGYNVIVDERLEGTVTVSLRELPLWDAVDALLSGRGFVRHTTPGGVVMIVPQSEADAETVMREFQPKYIVINEELINSVASVLSPRGTAKGMPLIGSLVVTDAPSGIERAELLMQRLDRPARQIIIEARIVEVDSLKSRSLGIAWGVDYQRVSGDVFGGLGSVSSSVGVNLPLGAGTAAGDGMTLGIGILSDPLALRVGLEALETTGDARTVSTPKVQVMENQAAHIGDSEDIAIKAPSGSVVSSGSSPDSKSALYQVFSAGLQMNVIARVLQEQTVELDLDVKKESFDYLREVDGLPTRVSKSARTRLSIASGRTLVIGGINVEDEVNKERSVPGLSRIPVIGALFRGRARTESRRELLIFLTPTIIMEGKEHVATGSSGDI